MVTSCQLALAFPDQNFFASLVKFMGIFAVTQVPIAIAEGILSVMIFNVLASSLMLYKGVYINETLG